MNVYPINLIAGASLSGNVLSYSDVRNIYHKYLNHRAYFAQGVVPTIAMEWTTPLYMDSLIIANTNCTKAIISVAYSSGAPQVFIRELDIARIEFFELDPLKLTRKISVSFTAPVNAQPYVGYCFAGNKMILPRFTVNPEREPTMRGESQRTNNGQSYGKAVPTLDKISVKYLRIPDDTKKIVDDYIQSVQKVVPHIVDWYPEAHEAFPPLYVTLTTGPVNTKRAENDFFWDFNLGWLEAR